VAVTRTARRDPGTTPQQRYLRAVEVGTARSAAAAVPKFGVGPKRQELLFAQSVLLGDLGVLVASFFLAYLLRTRLWWTSELLPLREFVWVLGLIIVDGALKPFGPRAETEKFFAPFFEHYQQKAPEFIDGMLRPTRADLKPGIRTAMLGTPDYVAISAMKGMLDDSIWTDDQIKVPVLAVMAEKPWPANNDQVYKTVAPDLDYRRWTGVSHFLMMERPKEFNEAVAGFISKKHLL